MNALRVLTRTPARLTFTVIVCCRASFLSDAKVSGSGSYPIT